MEFWNHCECPYPFVPAEVLDAAPSVRASLPNKYCEPEIAAGLYEEIWDEYRLCDEIGINIVTRLMGLILAAMASYVLTNDEVLRPAPPAPGSSASIPVSAHEQGPDHGA